ncbi:hypothetical protein VNO77_32957 [Canavalia gladiata]|uniref:Uncharacterized protein n=1 Tax=Canavalia gladiata TaxID=3824 RepID=A0AAN9Q000_CANGL
MMALFWVYEGLKYNAAVMLGFCYTLQAHVADDTSHKVLASKTSEGTEKLHKSHFNRYKNLGAHHRRTKILSPV